MTNTQKQKGIFKSMQTDMVYFRPEVQFPFDENYGNYVNFTKTGVQHIYTGDLTRDNWRLHLEAVTNILRDGIECEFLHKGKFIVSFVDADPGDEIELSIFDYFFNLMHWSLILNTGDKITPNYIFFESAITQGAIKKFVDGKFLEDYIKIINDTIKDPEQANMIINRIIDDCLHEFNRIDDFSMYLANTINLEDSIDLMNKYPEFDNLMNLSLSSCPIEDIKDEGMRQARRAIEIMIEDGNHCLADSFRAKEGINPRQHKEFATHIGTKPDGEGGIFPISIDRSFINGGVADPISFYIESHGGRTAQIIAKCNVGTSGHFARIVGLNNKDTRLHNDPSFDCGSTNLQMVTITCRRMLEMFDKRYYKKQLNGVLYRLNSDKDEHLIGQTLYFRSPMTCASSSRGDGICYKCYGDLAYINATINIGKLAAELLSAALTQRLLSAKHLLESKAKKLKWVDCMKDYFYFDYNLMKPIEDFDWAGWKLIMDLDDVHMESEEDEFEYNEYIDKFSLRAPDGRVIDIYTEECDPIYISSALNMKCRYVQETEHGTLELDMTKLEDLNLFLVHINNDELSAALDMIKAVVNKVAITKQYDRHSWLQKFCETIIEGGLSPTAVHLEIVLSNQIRAKGDILNKPDWSCMNQEEYQILTLNKALTNHPSITTTMLYQKLNKTFYDPLSFKKTAPGTYDLMFMEHPQEFMSDKGIIDYDYSSKSDIEEAQPLVTFDKKED